MPARSANIEEESRVGVEPGGTSPTMNHENMVGLASLGPPYCHDPSDSEEPG